MLDIQVIDDPGAATVALEPTRSRLLSELVEPASAATLATRVGLARQKVNYHLHALEAHALVRLAEERKWGGLTERLLVATAASYVISPSALGPVAVDPNRETDRLSASYCIALGARVVREVGDLVRRANEAGKRLATLAVDTEVRFRSATDRAAFTSELTEAITKLVSKYHDESAPGGRAHRLVVVAHPLPQKSDPKEPSGAGRKKPPEAVPSRSKPRSPARRRKFGRPSPPGRVSRRGSSPRGARSARGEKSYPTSGQAWIAPPRSQCGKRPSASWPRALWAHPVHRPWRPSGPSRLAREASVWSAWYTACLPAPTTGTISSTAWSRAGPRSSASCGGTLRRSRAWRVRRVSSSASPAIRRRRRGRSWAGN